MSLCLLCAHGGCSCRDRNVCKMSARCRKNCFRPDGVTSSSCPEEVFLNLDEYESLRLADFEGLYQEQAASRMTFRADVCRIVEAARRKVADSSSTEDPPNRGRFGVYQVRRNYPMSPFRHALGLRKSGDGSICPHCRKQL